jgi:DNA polymerase-3 subunit delta'
MSVERLAPEQYDTLDGVLEPAENPFVAGHAQASNMLMQAYRGGKLPHALILAGPVGIGKATLAFHLANPLLKYPDHASAPEKLAVPDPASSLFRQIASGAHPSVLHLTRPYDDRAKRFKTVLAVDEVRRVGQFLSLTSHDGGYRVVIVDAADDMNSNAANALLKNLEEPPKRTLFILVVHAPGSLLPTIRSRCQTVRLAPLSETELLSVLDRTEPPPPADAESRAALAMRAGGSVRAAILLTQYGGLEIAETLDRLAQSTGPAVIERHRLAEAVAGRDRSIPFDIFNRRALELLSGEAGEAARIGNLGRAKKLSDTWHDALAAISDTETYNLDKKQHALTMIERLNSVLRM